jgi:hypothetical protein
MSNEQTYEEGLRDGKINALEQISAMHDDRIETVEKRVSSLEKVAYAFIGALALLEFIPLLQEVISA